MIRISPIWPRKYVPPTRIPGCETTIKENHRPVPHHTAIAEIACLSKVGGVSVFPAGEAIIVVIGHIQLILQVVVKGARESFSIPVHIDPRTLSRRLTFSAFLRFQKSAVSVHFCAKTAACPMLASWVLILFRFFLVLSLFARLSSCALRFDLAAYRQSSLQYLTAYFSLVL